MPKQEGPAVGLLRPGSLLSGRFEPAAGAIDVKGVLREIDDTRAEQAARRLRLQSLA